MSTIAKENEGAILLKNALHRDMRSVLERQQQLKKWKKEYDDLARTLRSFPEKLSHNAMIPIGPSNVAFMPGVIKHTNEIYCPLGQNYFVLCSASHASSILSRHSLYLTDQLHQSEQEIEMVISRLGSDEVNDTETKVEKFDENTELIHHGEFVEIREIESLDSAVKKEAKKSTATSAPNQQQLQRNKKEDNDVLDSIFKEWDQIAKEEAEASGSGRVTTVRQSGDSIDDPSDIFSTITYNNTIANRKTVPTTESKFQPLDFVAEETKPKKPKKSVSFSTDVKPECPEPKKEPTVPYQPAFSGVIVEKNVDKILPPVQQPITTGAPRRVSRFKSERQK